MDNEKAPWEVGWGKGISGPTTPADSYFTVGGRCAKRERDRAFKDGDKTSPWPPIDFVLLTENTGRGHSETIAVFPCPDYPSEDGLKEAERRAKLCELAPKMQQFLEWAMGMPCEIWDSLPQDVRDQWKELVRLLPRGQYWGKV